jgi:hypothetical protein
MPKTSPAPQLVDLTAKELYQMHRTIDALNELEHLLRKRWGARSATVLHLDAVGADLDDVFRSESTALERAIMNKYFQAERVGQFAALSGAVKEMDALPKPG